MSSIKSKDAILNILGSAICSFGMYNIHDVADITEGGIFGMNLLLEHWFNISPGYTNFILTAICFFVGWKALGKSFIIYSAIATSSFSIFYFLFEQTPIIYPDIVNYPLLASIIGALFIGIGVGLCVSHNGAQTGDDALAMALNAFFEIKVSITYLISDLIVLILSLTYIPLNKILYSLITVILSGQIVELILKIKKSLSK